VKPYVIWKTLEIVWSSVDGKPKVIEKDGEIAKKELKLMKKLNLKPEKIPNTRFIHR
jgi:hypothetical protein